MSRIFIALTPQEDFNKAITSLKEEQKKFLYKGSKVNWSSNNQHHITLNFVGAMEPEQKEEMFESFNNFSNLSILPIEVSHLSYFPNENGKVLVANIALSTRLQKLYDKVESVVARIGFGMALRTFKPHMTLARFKDKDKPFSELVELENPITYSVNSLDVYERVFDSGKTVHTLVRSYIFE